MPSHINLDSLYPADRDRLAAFRLAADGVYRHLGPYLGKRLTIHLDGAQPDLIPEAPLKAGSMSLRQIYLQEDPTNLERVIEALGLLKDPDVDRTCAKALASLIAYVLGQDSLGPVPPPGPMPETIF